MSIIYVLLVIEDDLIANRIASLVGSGHSIVRFKETTESERWLTDNQQVDLIITDRTNGDMMVSLVRNKQDYRLVPFLIVSRLGESPLEQATLAAGVTDLLAINEDNYRIQTKISYYLSLSDQIRTFDNASPIAPTYQFRLPWWKRFLDISVSFTILLLLSPVLLIVAAVIVLDSKGPVIYRSKRAGANFHVFNMYKFRTMRVEADQLLGQLASNNIYDKTDKKIDSSTNGSLTCSVCEADGVPCQKLLFDHDRHICEKHYLQETQGKAKFMKFRNDPRITRIGTFLRNSSIDELPQLFNILVGDMSLVGNRPLPLYEAEKLTSDEFARRFAGPAGLTGLWQVKKRGKGQGPMSDKERTLLDIEYSSTFSFKTDALIIWQTLFSLWQKENV